MSFISYPRNPPPHPPSTAVIGKAEGRGTDWHGHISALSVSQECRGGGVGRTLCRRLEGISDSVYHGYFVDLFVRVSNVAAIQMYRKLGYTVFRRVLGYYGGEEDAFDMRLALSRDTAKASVVPLPVPVRPDELWPEPAAPAAAAAAAAAPAPAPAAAS